MKILSVKFLNLNSLRGEKGIRFDQTPFIESGLFAITGPTGAGKTTILDAITAALYGKVHRHDDVKEIMSRHTAESYAEVEFEVKGEAYRAKWSVHRSRGKADGNFRDEKMELSEVSTGKMIGGHTATTTKAAIVDLCGLDYSQFLRSVILSQGDFTKFLKASDSERSDLLEKITDTAIYTDISRFVFSRQRDEKEKLDGLSARLEDTILLTDEEVNSHQGRLDELAEAEKTKKQEKEQITSHLNWLAAIEKLKAQLELQAEELAEKELLFAEKLPDFHALEWHELAVTFRPQLVEIKTVKEQADAIQAEISRLNNALPGYDTAAAEALATFNLAAAALEKAQQQLKDEAPVLEQVARMDTNLENLGQQVARLKLQMEQAQQTVENLQAGEQQKTTASNELQQRLAGLEQWLAEHDGDKTLDKQLITHRQFHNAYTEQDNYVAGLAKENLQYGQSALAETQKAEQNQALIGRLQKSSEEKQQLISSLTTGLKAVLDSKTQEELELSLNQLPLILQSCEQQYRTAVNHQKNREEKEKLISAIAESKLSLKKNGEALASIEKEKVAAGLHLVDLRELVLVQERIQKYEADRGSLIEGQECPLCGAIHHPYAENNVHAHVSEAVQKKTQQELLFNELSQKFQRDSLELNTLSGTFSAKENELSTLEKTLAGLEDEFAAANVKLSEPLHIENPGAIASLIQTSKNTQTTLQQTVDSVRNFARQIQEAQHEFSNARENMQTAQGQSALILERANTFATQQKRVEGLIREAEQKRELTMTELSKLLQSLGIAFNPGQFAQTEQILTARAGAYAKATGDLQQVRIDKAALVAELAGLRESLVVRTGESSNRAKEHSFELEKQNNLRAERAGLFGGKDPLAERQRLEQAITKAGETKETADHLSTQQKQRVENTQARIVEENKTLTTSTNRLQQLQSGLIILLNERGIQDTETLQTLFLPGDTAQQLIALRKELEARIDALKELAKNTRSALTAELAKNLTEQPAADLTEQLAALEIEFSTLNQEIGKLKQVLLEDQLTRSKFAEIAAQIELQKSEFARWNKLNALIGSGDGKKFSRFAQGLTLSRLTDLANLHLQKLSDRYQILKSSENDLELLIIDGYQADVVRPTSSLSGGESFLVSLSLALGLSDLASHKVQINSLFIDEGFGTLDAETLDTAISALENLQAKGKTIGIISHVEALKERIGTQIQLSKLPGGVSKIKIVEYGAVLFEV